MTAWHLKGIARGGWARLKGFAIEAAGGPARLQVILVLAGILALDTADKAAVSAVASSLKQAFGIGNTEIGVLIASVSFVGALFTLPAGVLVDRMRRKRILMVAIGIWSVAMLISGTAHSFLYLLGARVFLGAVTAVAAPAVASLTGDFFPARERARIYGMILAGELMGAGFGFLVGGEVSSWLDWRWSLYAMAVPGAALVFVIWRFLPEPARGGGSSISLGQQRVPGDDPLPRDRAAQSGQDGENYQRSDQGATMRELTREAGIEPREDLVLHQDPTGRSLWWVIGYVVRTPTYRLLIVASALGYYFFAGVRAFAMIYFTQRYDASRAVLSALVIVIGVGAIVGVVMGGRVSERLLERKRIDARIVVPGAALFISVLFFAPAILVTNLVLGIPLLALGAAALAAANPSIDAARLDVMHPRLWGRAEAGRTALRSVLEGCAPILFGLVSGWLGGGEGGLMWTYLLMLIPLLVASSLAIPARRTYPRDVATAAASIRELSGSPEGSSAGREGRTD